MAFAAAGVIARATSIGRPGRWLTTAISAIVFALLLVHTTRSAPTAPWNLTGRMLTGCVVAGLLYIAAHLMRAFRLAVIAMPLLGASFRTTVLLHLFVAPWSLIMPLKLDEIIRFTELGRTSKSWSRPIIVLLIDRSMDGAILIAMSLLLLASGRSSVAGPVALIGFGLLLLVLAFFILPILLEKVQRHVFANHYQDRALRVLAAVSKVRGALVVSRQAINSAGAFLVLATVGIWSMELAAVASLLVAIDSSTVSLLEVVETTLRRADGSWRVMLGLEPSGGTIALLTFVFFDALLLTWIWVPVPYLRRRIDEPRRLRMAEAAGNSLPSIRQA